MLKSGVINRLFIILFCSLFLSACNIFDETTRAAQQVLSGFVSDKDFTVESSKVLWEGKDKKGRNAYMVEMHFTGKNGFGVRMSECGIVTFSRVGKELYWNRSNALNGCWFDDDDSRALGMTQDDWLRIIAMGNDISLNTEGKVQSEAAEDSAPNDVVQEDVTPVAATTPDVPIVPMTAEPARDFAAEAIADLQIMNSASVSVAAGEYAPFPDKHPHTILNLMGIEQSFRKLMGRDFEEFLDNITVANDVQQSPGRKALYGEGMLPHSGGTQAGAFVIDENGRIFSVLYDEENGEFRPFRIYGARSFDELPEQLKSYINNKRG